ncbi:hypothetical protein [Streptomyces roseifaciens]|nr:hypothetical protein [Streptomyces roseifaciens]
MNNPPGNEYYGGKPLHREADDKAVRSGGGLSRHYVKNRILDGSPFCVY